MHAAKSQNSIKRNASMTVKPRSALVWAGISHYHRLLFFIVAISLALSFAPFSRSDALVANVEQNSPKAENKSAGQSKFTTLEGARIHYVNYGKSDDAIVLIHGWTMNVDNW